MRTRSPEIVVWPFSIRGGVDGPPICSLSHRTRGAALRSEARHTTIFHVVEFSFGKGRSKSEYPSPGLNGIVYFFISFLDSPCYFSRNFV